MGPCSSYKSSETCGIAHSTDQVGICNWDKVTKSCKIRTCIDSGNNYETDAKCEGFLLGCKSNGASCINSEFTCSELITA